MNLDSKIYVAGHRGLVGSAIMRNLKAQGYNNLLTRTSAEMDLTDQAAVRQFFADEKPEYVFLAAAKVGGIYANNAYPAEFIQQNLAIQTNVIHESWRNNVKRMLFLGSSCIYPRDCPQPIKEEYLLTGPLEPSNRPYALAKIAGVEMCGSYNRQYGTQYLAAMPTNLYGPADNYNLSNSHVLPALIRKLHLAKLAQNGDIEGIHRDEAIYGPIPADLKSVLIPDPQSAIPDPQSSVVIWGTGTPRREFLYSEDMADACVYLMNMSDEMFGTLLKEGNAPLINIGCGTDLSILELAELAKDVVGFTGKLVFDTSKPDGTPRKLLDVGKLAKLGWKLKVELREGIRLAYMDYMNKAG